MKKGYLVYWNHCKTGVQKFRVVRTFKKADRLRNLLENQSRYLVVWVTEFKDV